MDTDAQRRQPCRDEGRDRNDASASQGAPRIAGNPGSRRKQKGSFPGAFGGSLALLIPRPLTPGLQDCEMIQSHQLVSFVMAAPALSSPLHQKPFELAEAPMTSLRRQKVLVSPPSLCIIELRWFTAGSRQPPPRVACGCHGGPILLRHGPPLRRAPRQLPRCSARR